MKKRYLEILKEDFDWIEHVPSFLEIGEPLSIKNPKDKYRLHWTSGHGEDYGRWSDDWSTFNADNAGIDGLTRLIRIITETTSVNARRPVIDLGHLIDMAFNQDQKWVLRDDWWSDIEEMRKSGDDEDFIKDMARDWLQDYLHDEGVLSSNDYYDEYSTIEQWWVTYFDKYGIEFSVKVNAM